MKKGLTIGFILVILVFGFMFYTILSLHTKPESNPELITFTEEKVLEYLIQEKRYSENDILKAVSSKKAKSSDFSASGYEVAVIFSDEPKAIYYYHVVEDKVEQFGINGHAVKHKEIP